MIQRVTVLAGLILATAAVAQASGGGFLFVTFRGEATPMTEQICFLVSQDGRDWTALNDANPVLVSTVGEKGVRDPFLLRSPDNKTFYLIATDLSIHLTDHDWGRAQTAASRSIVVWESPDLADWSEPRLVKVAPDNAGCTWAPEAVYDADRGDYMVFWASKTDDDNFRKHRIWAARTKDFKTFGDPFVYIEKPTTVIDTTIVRDNDVYYRFTKDEKFKAITMETSDNLMNGWRDVDTFSLAELTGYEGPTCFKIDPARDDRPARWCLLLDWYSRGRGYQSYEAADLSRGDFAKGTPMQFPFHPVRHGTVLPITQKEMARLLRRWGPDEPPATGSASAPRIAVDAAHLDAAPETSPGQPGLVRPDPYQISVDRVPVVLAGCGADHRALVFPSVVGVIGIEGSIRDQTNGRCILAEGGYGIAKVIPAVEIGDVRSPGAPCPRYFFLYPGR